MTEKVTSPISEERVKELFGPGGRMRLLRLILSRKILLAGIEKLVISKARITVKTLSIETGLHVVTVRRHKDLWIHLWSGPSQAPEQRAKIKAAMEDLQKRGKEVSATSLQSITGLSPSAVMKNKKFWKHLMVPSPPRKSKTTLILATIERLAANNEPINTITIAKASGLSKNDISQRRRGWKHLETAPLVNRSHALEKRIKRIKRILVQKSPSEIFRESVEKLVGASVCEQETAEVQQAFSVLRWYVDLAPTIEDRDWIRGKYNLVATELNQRNNLVHQKVLQKAMAIA